MEQFTPTVEWMERTYYRLNDELFNGYNLGKQTPLELL
jgi:hypothetical protein